MDNQPMPEPQAAASGASPVPANPSFGDRLYELTLTRSRLCVGIDPHPALLEQWGLPQSAAGLAEFSARCVEAFGPRVALVKPQVAFFEAYGSAGYAVLEKTITDLHAAGALVLADAKRGDIGSTMAAYAAAWLSADSSLTVDALTIAPYMGMGALAPAVELAAQNGKGVYVLAATSNPEATEVQTAQTRSGMSVSQAVINECGRLNAELIAATGSRFGHVGVVVGATLGMSSGPAGRTAPDLSQLGGSVLLPGVGAQGAGPADVDRLTSGNKALACPNISRAILRSGPDVADLIAAVEANSQDYAGVVLN